jgi:cardiolipin synthase
VAATRLLIQPGAGTAPIVEAIDQAQEYIHIVIFRFDRGEVEAALRRAVKRGVFVHALVAFTMAGQGGERTLRKLELRLLSNGVTVTRTAMDLVRYHDKLMIVDGRTLFVLGFNYTYLDVDRSRCFGVVTDRAEWVAEAGKLFAADSLRQPYTPGCETFVVSPGNARERLTELIKSARGQLLIFDGKLSDPKMMNLLALKVKEGVEVRVIGAVGRRAAAVQAVQPTRRLHAQVIVRDGEEAFIGSQSLRTLELDARREVGLILAEPEIVRQLTETFEADWEKSAATKPARAAAANEEHADAELNAAVTTLPANVVKAAVKEAIRDAVRETFQEIPAALPLRETVKDATKEALRELVQAACLAPAS